MKSINTFWNWFQDNHHTIGNIFNETPVIQTQTYFWLKKHLNYYCTEIDAMILIPKKGSKKAELVITAKGNPDYFSQVIQLVNAAPALRTWKFTAFIQPYERIDEMIEELDKPFIFQDITLKTSQLKFVGVNFYEDSKKWDIIIFCKQYNIYCDSKTFYHAINFIIRELLGEKSLYKNINLVHLEQMPDNEEDLIYLYDLQAYMDTFKI